MGITREYSYDTDGNRKLTKETVSQGRYEVVDLILRIVGSSVIIVTIFGLGCNINAQRKQQQVLFQLGVYEKALPIINKLCVSAATDSSYGVARNVFTYEIVPKIHLTNKDRVIKHIDDLDTLLILREHFAGLTDSFRFMSRSFGVLVRDYEVGNISKDSIYYNDFEQYHIFFANKKYQWDSHKLYSRAFRIAFPDSTEQKEMLVKTFYAKLFAIINGYDDLWVYNKSGRRPLDSSSLAEISLEQFGKILNDNGYLMPGTLLVSFKPYYDQLEQIDIAIFQRMNDLQSDILAAMNESNR